MRKAIICFLEKNGEVLLLHTDYGREKVWNGVSGYINEGEQDTKAAVREIKEEIGVDVEAEDLIKKGVQGIFTVFVLNKWSGMPEPQESSIKEVKWFRKNNLPYSQMHEGSEGWLLRLNIVQ